MNLINKQNMCLFPECSKNGDNSVYKMAVNLIGDIKRSMAGKSIRRNITKSRVPAGVKYTISISKESNGVKKALEGKGDF